MQPIEEPKSRSHRNMLALVRDRDQERWGHHVKSAKKAEVATKGSGKEAERKVAMKLAQRLHASQGCGYLPSPLSARPLSIASR